MSEYIVKGAEPNETVLHRITPNGYEGWSWLPVLEEIVRCRDCKLHVKKGRRLYCDLNAGGFPEVEPDGFCAWGERNDA